MKLESAGFKTGDKIPKKYTYTGQNISPQISWDDAPEGTKSFVLIADDPDAPPGNWVHWLVYNVPVEAHSLSEDIDGISHLKDGTLQGQNDFRQIGYDGPIPPEGHGSHRYFFRLYALDIKLTLRPGANRTELERAMKGHILEQTELMGTYER